MSDSLLRQALERYGAGDVEGARTAAQAVLEGSPGHPVALHILGLAHLAAGDGEEAVARLAEAAKAAPDDASIHNSLSAALKTLGRFGEALTAMEHALERAPDEAVYVHNLAALLRDLGRHEETAAYYRALLEKVPEDREALRALAKLAAASEETGEALDLYGRLLALEPRDRLVRKAMAELWILRNEPDKARTCLEEGLAVLPGDTALRLSLSQCLSYVPGSADEMRGERRRALAVLDEMLAGEIAPIDPLAEGGATNFALSYQGEDDREAQEKLAAVYARACPGLAWVAPHCRPGVARRPGPLRIGFLSSFFGEHTIARLNAGLILALAERDDLEVSLFSAAKPNIPLFGPLAEGGLRRVILPRNLEAARAALAGTEQDLLYYTDIGMEPLTYFLAFARLAPVQCASWGHPRTTGLPSMDYFLSGTLIEGEEADGDYSEDLIRFPGVNLIYAESPAQAPPLDRSALGLKGGERLYLCCQSLIKIHPDFDPLVEGILRADQGAVVAFIGGRHGPWSGALLDRLGKRLGETVHRIRILPRVERETFLSLLRGADVILDTPYFSGGNTVLEAISLGVPLVTMEGRYMRGRMASGLLRLVGAEALVAPDAQSYIATAVRLAGDEAERAAASRLIAAGRAILFNNPALVDRIAGWMKDAIAKRVPLG